MTDGMQVFETDVEPGAACALVLDGVGKGFGATRALDGATLRLPDGSCTVLAGANGAGKSTLLRLAQGLQTADAGRLETLGLDPARRGAAVRANTGYVPEDVRVGYGGMTVGRLLEHHRAYYRGWDEGYAAELMRRLDAPTGRRMSRLSKGEARRVQLIMALAHRPRLLLLDEPTDGLDPVARDEVLALLSEYLADTGCTTVISTHLVHEVQGIADRAAVLRGGQVLANVSRERLHRELARYRGVPPEGWTPPETLAGRVLATDGFGRERRWTIAGDEAEVRRALAASGVAAVDVAPLTLDEAVLVLLRAEMNR